MPAWQRRLSVGSADSLNNQRCGHQGRNEFLVSALESHRILLMGDSTVARDGISQGQLDIGDIKIDDQIVKANRRSHGATCCSAFEMQSHIFHRHRKATLTTSRDRTKMRAHIAINGWPCPPAICKICSGDRLENLIEVSSVSTIRSIRYIPAAEWRPP